MFIEQWGGEVDFQTMKQKCLKTKQLSYVFLLSECKVTTRISYFQMKQALFFIYTRKKPPSAMLKEVFSLKI